jgi:TPR repeat protein/dienelactone hydrolase
MRRRGLGIVSVVGVFVVVAAGWTGCATNSGDRETSGEGPSIETTASTDGKSTENTLLDAREEFETELTREVDIASGPAPEPPGERYRKVHYESPAGELAAYVSQEPEGEGPHPVLVWAHGGFGGIGEFVWQKRSGVLEPFIEAGFVVVVPSWRGENENPGQFEMFYGEVRDLVAAVRWARRRPYVDRERIYLAGHSSGGTLALLAAESTPHLRAVFSFGAAVDMQTLFADSDDPYGNTPFDPARDEELTYRSAADWIDRLQVPSFYIEGVDSSYPVSAELLEEVAAKRDIPLHSYVVDGGDHVNILEPLAGHLAERLAEDTGEQVDLGLSQRVVQAAFDEATDHETHYEPKDGNFFARSCRDRHVCGDCHALGWAYESGFIDGPKYDQAMTWFREGCDEGVEESCKGVARLYFNGRGVEPDKRKAYKYLARGCETAERDLSICDSAAAAYAKGKHVRQDRERARQLAEIACDGGRGKMCKLLGQSYVRRGRSGDHRAARDAFERACEAESPDYGGCTYAGHVYENGLVGERDYDRAWQYYRRACQNGFGRGCHSLGVMVATGRGVEKDEQRAVDYYRVACARGSEMGCTDLGNRMVDGWGTSKDAERGADMVIKTCETSEYPYACTHAGDYYREGTGVTADPATAASYYRRGCEGHYPRGCLELAEMLEKGAVPAEEVDGEAPEYYRRARKLLEKTCQTDHDGRDCARLAELVRDGRGGPKDEARAEELFERGCQYDQRACDWQ